jgi:hypothetical protein
MTHRSAAVVREDLAGRISPDHGVKSWHRSDQVLVTTLGYGSRTMPAARVDRIVDRASGKSQRDECHQCDNSCHLCS